MDETIHTPRPRPVTTHVVSGSTVDPHSLDHTTISWRAVLAGAFVALLTYMILMSLGLAIGGANLQGVIQGDDSVRGLGIGAGIWTAAATLISLFVGGYAGGRVSGSRPIRVGRIQGVVVTALFFAFMFTSLGSAIGSIGRGLGSAVGAVGGAAGDVAGSPQVQSLVDEAIGDLDLRNPPQVVAKGVASRLIGGDTDGAVNYLARQARITPEEARQRIGDLGDRVSQTAQDAGTKAAQGLQIAGWTLFGSLLLGTIAGMIGGGVGVAANLRSPLSRGDRRAIDYRDREAA